MLGCFNLPLSVTDFAVMKHVGNEIIKTKVKHFKQTNYDVEKTFGTPCTVYRLKMGRNAVQELNGVTSSCPIIAIIKYEATVHYSIRSYAGNESA